MLEIFLKLNKKIQKNTGRSENEYQQKANNYKLTAEQKNPLMLLQTSTHIQNIQTRRLIYRVTMLSEAAARQTGDWISQ